MKRLRNGLFASKPLAKLAQHTYHMPWGFLFISFRCCVLFDLLIVRFYGFSLDKVKYVFVRDGEV